MNIVFFLTNATISFFLTFLSASLEFLYGEIWKVERRRAVERFRLGVGASACEIRREINCDYGFVDHPLGIEKEKTGHEVESELSDAEDNFRAIFEDLFDDSYAEVSYVISPKKWPQPSER